MIQVTILHRSGERMFTDRPLVLEDTLTTAYSYEMETPSAWNWLAEKVWRENNVVDGDERPVEHKTRSLSVGDVVRFDQPVPMDLYESDPTTTWMVARFGWKPIRPNMVRILAD